MRDTAKVTACLVVIVLLAFLWFRAMMERGRLRDARAAEYANRQRHCYDRGEVPVTLRDGSLLCVRPEQARRP
jgi:hypothetical protein